MKLTTTAFKVLFVFSCIAMAVVMGSSGALFSCGGLFMWGFASLLCFLTLLVCYLPIFLVTGSVDYLIKKVIK